MAYATGTASGPLDLYNKLITFLRTNADLVADGEAWQLAWQDTDSDDKVLRGPGLSNQDSVYIGFHLEQQPDEDAYWINLVGMTGVNASGTHYREHINVSNPVRFFVDTDTMTYWFIASGRRFMVVVKISTVFEAAYGGLFIPYAPPPSYGLPLFVGGSAGGDATAGPNSWRSADDNHRHFTSPAYFSSPINTSDPSAFMLDPMGQWLRVGNHLGDTYGNVVLAPESYLDAFGITVDGNGDSFRMGASAILTRIRECYGGSFPAFPFTLLQKSPTDQTYGILDGCYKVQGHSNASENIITIDGVQHLTVQNVYRTTIGDYWAMKLE